MFKMFGLDLQLFAENPEPVATEPQGQEQVTTDAGAEPAFDYENATRDQRIEAVSRFFMEPEQVTEEPAQEQQAIPNQQVPKNTEPPIEVPQKFLNSDGTPNVDALVKSYLNAEKKIGEQGNRMGQQGQQVQELMARIQQLESQVQHQERQPETLEQSEQQEDFNADQWFEKFYENPKEALQELFQGTVTDALSPQLQKLEPVVNYFEQQQERAYWESKVNEVRDRYSDFENYRKEAAEILRQQPAEFLNLPNAVEAAYLMAKAEVLDAEKASQPKIEDMLKDPSFLQELSKNSELQKIVLKTYSEEINKEPKPTMIGSHPGSAAPATPPPEIRSTKDATRAMMAFMARGG